MIFPESVEFQPLPGSDALKTAYLFETTRPLPYDEMQRNLEEGAYRTYLENDAYNRYVHIHKVLVGEGGAQELRLIAEELETQELPTYLDAAGWAYAESGLASRSHSTVERVALVRKAEEIWARCLINTINIGENLGDEHRFGENEGHRAALNLAYAPLIKSIIVGNVRPNIVQQTFLDTAEVAHNSKLSLDRAYKEGDKNAGAFHRGFLFEASALMALLYLDDLRYIPLPATARGDSGYYHREQTHDISIINQHWGDIKKVIPVEIKSKASLRDKRRYNALVIQGKLRLSVGSIDPRDTTEAFYDLLHAQATIEQFVAIEQLSTQLREMLRLYQRGINADGLAMNSLTRFYDSKKVAQIYPEHSKEAKLK
ncbi:MAG: hypothetical protein ACOH18_02150 [Candidatus Saccharimonadaceae bacterium]